MAHFSPELFAFLKELKRNNNREWFDKNKPRYEEHLKKPALAFIEDFAPRLYTISPSFVASPKAVGGSLFRIYRDTRFSKDKTPYKTAVGIQFRHRAGKDAHAPGFYLHIEPGACFVGGGLWHPEPKVAADIRARIANDPTGWKKAAHGKSFRSNLTLGGDTLKRPPRGYDRDHPLIEDLVRKDFVASAELEDSVVPTARFIGAVQKKFEAAAPLIAFLCRAMGVDF